MKIFSNSENLCHISSFTNVEQNLEKYCRFENPLKPLSLDEKSYDGHELIHDYISLIQTWIEDVCRGACFS